VGGLRRTEARDEAETGAWPEGGVERGGRHGVRHDPDAVGRRAARSCGRAGATPARQPNLFNPTKEALHEVGRTDHDFTQRSVIRRRMKGGRNRPTGMLPGWKGPLWGRQPPDQARRRITDVV
jgi:hypothetical protein